MVLALIVVLLPTNAFAQIQTLHNQTLHKLAKQTSSLQQNPQIGVGKAPKAIGINQNTSTVYVANRDSDSVSIIDSTANEVVAGVTFHANPFNSGYILCDGLTIPSPTDQSIHLRIFWL